MDDLIWTDYQDNVLAQNLALGNSIKYSILGKIEMWERFLEFSARSQTKLQDKVKIQEKTNSALRSVSFCQHVFLEFCPNRRLI